MLDTLDADAVRRWARAAVASLERHRAEIDRLNVFPVHDSDTGTNLLTTLRSASDALADDGDGPHALQAFARGAVLGACGNSGNILAQLLRGLADSATGTGHVDVATVRAGLARGAAEARTAVAEPVEDTLLSVASAAATAATAADAGATLAEVVGLALAAADDALARTTDQLPALAAAGVVDAGGQGLVLVLEALVDTVGGAGPQIAPVPTSGPITTPAPQHGGAFEVQYLLDTVPDFDEAALRADLVRLGDSVVVVGTGDDTVRTWSVHVHTDDAGAAVELGIRRGTPYRISVSRLDGPGDAHHLHKPGAVIALVPGEGLARLFEQEGVHVVAGSTVDEVVAEVLAAGTRDVVLLPNSAHGTGVAEAAAARVRERGIRAAVVATRSPVQGLAAVAVHDAARHFDDDVVAMAEAAAATRFAEVAIAERESLTTAGICQAGDVLGLIDGEVVEIGRGRLAVALSLVDRLLGVGAELMTVLVGAGADAGTGAVVRRHVRDRSPLTEVTVYDAGQPHLPLIIGVE